MKSILLVYRVNEHSKKLSGVYKKLIGKASELDRQGVEVYAVFMQLNKAVFTKIAHHTHSVLAFSDVIEIKNEQSDFWNFAQGIIQRFSFDMVYVRYERMFSKPVVADFFAALRTNNPQTVRAVEFATFPYEYELKCEEKSKLDVPNRLQVLSLVDEIFSPASVDTIDGYSYTPFCNKFDINSPDIKDLQLPDVPPQKRCFNLIIVANIMFWHGVDRVINGIANATNEVRQKVHLHVVGEGEEKAALESLVQSLGLGQYVTFHGYKSGSELSDLYATADVGISSIGLHRQGLDECSDLKSREYVVHGLPLIKSFVDIDIDKLPYVMNIPADDSALKIADVVQFIQEHYQKNHKQIVSESAKQVIGWHSFVADLISKGTKHS